MNLKPVGNCPKCKSKVTLDYDTEGCCTNKKCGVKLRWKKSEGDGNYLLVEVVKFKTT